MSYLEVCAPALTQHTHINFYSDKYNRWILSISLGSAPFIFPFIVGMTLLWLPISKGSSDVLSSLLPPVYARGFQSHMKGRFLAGSLAAVCPKVLVEGATELATWNKKCSDGLVYWDEMRASICESQDSWPQRDRGRCNGESQWEPKIWHGAKSLNSLNRYW